MFYTQSEATRRVGYVSFHTLLVHVLHLLHCGRSLAPPARTPRIALVPPTMLTRSGSS